MNFEDFEDDKEPNFTEEYMNLVETRLKLWLAVDKSTTLLQLARDVDKKQKELGIKTFKEVYKE